MLRRQIWEIDVLNTTTMPLALIKEYTELKLGSDSEFQLETIQFHARYLTIKFK